MRRRAQVDAVSKKVRQWGARIFYGETLFMQEAFITKRFLQKILIA